MTLKGIVPLTKVFPKIRFECHKCHSNIPYFRLIHKYSDCYDAVCPSCGEKYLFTDASIKTSPYETPSGHLWLSYSPNETNPYYRYHICINCGADSESEAGDTTYTSPRANEKCQPMSSKQPASVPVSELPVDKWALASLILSLLSLCSGALAGVPAIVIGFIALRNIDESGKRFKGKGFAWTGIVLGFITSALSICLVLVALLSDVSTR